MIYHLIAPDAWQAAQAAGVYAPPSLHSEGFIHFADAQQVLRVANAFYRDVPGLLLLAVDPARVQADIRYEAPQHPDGRPASDTEKAERFPHGYGALNLDAVMQVQPMPVDSDGHYYLPDDLL